MHSVRVIAGSLKGRAIPFEHKKFDHADITPQKVKGALFSIVGDDLAGKSFLDLFGCSGQVSVEAVSRGAESVVVCELERNRSQFIQDLAERLECSTRLSVLQGDFRRRLKSLFHENRSFNVVFADPPYDKTKGFSQYIRDVFDYMEKYPVLAEKGILVIQHWSKNNLPEVYGPWILEGSKKYGLTSLSVYTVTSDQ